MPNSAREVAGSNLRLSSRGSFYLPEFKRFWGWPGIRPGCAFPRWTSRPRRETISGYGLAQKSGFVPRLCDRVSDAGGRLFAQVHSRRFDVMLNFEGQLPFDRLPTWSALRALPLAEQKEALRHSSLRTRWVHEAHHGDYGSAVGAEARKPDYDWVFIVEDALGPHASLGQLLRRGVRA